LLSDCSQGSVALKSGSNAIVLKELTPFLKDVIRLIDEQISLLKTIYDSGSRNTIIVPDTNSLVYNPNLEDWEYSDIPKFELILTSTVLEELDKLKMFRNDDVRRKAEGVITRLKGYRTRGRLIDGVPLRKEVFEGSEVRLCCTIIGLISSQ
jgi:hypothetical protein